MTSDTPRLFIGLPIPVKARESIENSMRNFKDYIEQPVPAENWHITLMFLGSVENPKQYFSRLEKPLLQSFVPTVSVTHIGRGIKRDQLWAYITPTPALLSLKEAIATRTKALRMQYEGGAEHDEFVPHIRIANLYDVTKGIGIPDGAAKASYTVHMAHVYQSHQTDTGTTYSIEASIPLSP